MFFSQQDFKKTPTNYNSICQLISAFSEKKNEPARQVMSLLETTRNFIVYTADDNKDSRATWPQEDLLQILEDTALGLAKFLAIRSVDDPAYQYCQRFIMERMRVLQDNKDEIFSCYASNDNTLKKILPEMPGLKLG